jgi:hypothetical protein
VTLIKLRFLFFTFIVIVFFCGKKTHHPTNALGEKPLGP